MGGHDTGRRAKLREEEVSTSWTQRGAWTLVRKHSWGWQGPGSWGRGHQDGGDKPRPDWRLLCPPLMKQVMGLQEPRCTPWGDHGGLGSVLHCQITGGSVVSAHGFVRPFSRCLSSHKLAGHLSTWPLPAISLWGRPLSVCGPLCVWLWLWL